MEIDLRGNRYSFSASRAAELRRGLANLVHNDRHELTLVEIAGSDPLSDLCRALEQTVFDDTFGAIVPHTPDTMAAEYGPYEDCSRFFAAINNSNLSIAGSLRVIEGYPTKTTTDLIAARLTTDQSLNHRYRFDPTTTWDIGSVTVDKSYRRSLRKNPVSIPLYRALYVAALREGITDGTSVIDIDVLSYYRRLGIPFERLDDLRDVEYLGSKSTACYLEVARIAESMRLAAEDSSRQVKRTINAILHGSASTPEMTRTLIPDSTGLIEAQTRLAEFSIEQR
jgi:N-acyl-L-homoserine lactone synthetase